MRGDHDPTGPRCQKQAFAVLPYHTRSGTFGALTGTPASSVSYTATAANVVYP
jgi:hypothetical protein